MRRFVAATVAWLALSSCRVFRGVLHGPTCLAEEPARGRHDALVGSYYYPWYTTERWTREPVTDTPRLGWYSSDDRRVADAHIRQARQADIDFFLVSWQSFAVAAPFVDDDQPMLLITSFNEWHEGTELEPSGEYGEKYLDLTRELVAPLRGRPSRSP
jgi:hypothetical protein